MSPKQKVLEKYTAAYSASFAECWVVYRDYGMQLGVGKSAALAWKNAAENIAPGNEGGCEASKPTLAEVIEYAEYLTEGDECLSVQTEILRIVTEHAARAAQEHTDDLAVNRFAEAMKKKLSKKRKEGRSGWDDPEQCSIDFLIRLLHDHYQKGDVVDIANICMMLNQRGAKADWRLPADRLTAMTALERENKELRQRIRQFEFCIGRVAIALGGVCCGGVDVTLQHLQADPHSTTRVLCDAIAALRPLRKEGK